jgi:hypothetical protein
MASVSTSAQQDQEALVHLGDDKETGMTVEKEVRAIEKAFVKLPPDERQRILKKVAKDMKGVHELGLEFKQQLLSTKGVFSRRDLERLTKVTDMLLKESDWSDEPCARGSTGSKRKRSRGKARPTRSRRVRSLGSEG